MERARPKSLLRAMDNDVQQFVSKLMDGGDKALPSVKVVLEAIQQSNSSLKRKRQPNIQDSIERTLQSLAEAQPSGSGPREVPDDVEESGGAHAPDAMNRHLRKYLSASGHVSTQENAEKDSQSRNLGTTKTSLNNYVAKATAQEQPSTKITHPERMKRRKEGAMDTAPPTHTTLDDIGGMGEIVRYFKDNVLLPLLRPTLYLERGISPPRGVLLFGPPGCGKTFLVEAVAGTLGLPFLRISAPSIVSGMSGESEKQLRQHFEYARSLAPCLMFIDEIDTIAPKRESAQREMERRIVGQLLTCMDDLALEKTEGKPVMVLAATNRPDSLDPALRRAGRFDAELLVKAPNAMTRESILRAQTRKVKIDPNVDLEQIANMTTGFVGADLKFLVFTAGSESMSRTRKAFEDSAHVMGPDFSKATVSNGDCSGMMEVDSQVSRIDPRDPDVQAFKNLHAALLANTTATTAQDSVTHTDFLTALPKIQPSARREGFTTIPDTTWASIGALDTVRQQLFSAVVHPIRKPALYQRFQIAVPIGIILYGPPGCGKTLLAKAVANEAGASFIAVNGPELLNKYVGESERAIRQMFARAAASIPCVVFFDELDALVPTRSNGNSESSNRVVAQLLTELDGLKDRSGIYVIGATNRLDVIDPAVLRPGRFGKHLFVGLPNAKGRSEILEAQLRHIPAKEVKQMKEYAMIKCDGFSGADLHSLVVEAVQKTLGREGTELELQDMMEARKVVAAEQESF